MTLRSVRVVVVVVVVDRLILYKNPDNPDKDQNRPQLTEKKQRFKDLNFRKRVVLSGFYSFLSGFLFGTI